MSIYLDNQAAKPVDVRVMAEMTLFFNEKFANPASLHCGHAVELAVYQHLHGIVPEAGCENAVAGRGLTTALHVPEDGCAALEPGPLGDLSA